MYNGGKIKEGVMMKDVFPELKVEKVDIDSIKPYERNAKLHPAKQIEQIKRSILDYGMRDPIGVWKDQIVEGHGRYMALKEIGAKTIPIIRLDDLTDEQRREYTLVHNQTTLNSDFDFDVLDLEIDDLPDFDVEFYDFKLPEEIEEVEDDDFDGQLPETPMTRKGDIWLLGEHRLICGDSTVMDDVKRLMDGVFADLLLTDPPYNVNYKGGTKDKLRIQNDNMDDDFFHQFLRDAFMSADSVMRDGAVFYIWHAESEGYNFRGACRDVDWQVRECLIWNKNSMVMGRQDYQWKHEPCLYGWKSGASHLWTSDRKQTTILDFDRPTVSDLHPTMKPISLLAYQINNNTHKGDIVLDIFCGSGSTLIACEQLERKCYAVELDERYCDVIVQRYIDFKGSDEDVFLVEDGEKIPFSEV
mgnify:CR=1 FL=1